MPGHPDVIGQGASKCYSKDDLLHIQMHLSSIVFYPSKVDVFLKIVDNVVCGQWL